VGGGSFGQDLEGFLKNQGRIPGSLCTYFLIFKSDNKIKNGNEKKNTSKW